MDVVELQGHFVWYELMTTDVEAARVFYAKVMDWGTWDASMPSIDYVLFTVEGTRVSGVMGLPEKAKKMNVVPRWIGYVGVNDVDAVADRIEQLGGTVHVPPTDIPNSSRFLIFADPQTAMLGALKWLGAGHCRPGDTSAPGRVGWHELVATNCEKALAFYGELFGWQNADPDVGALGTYQLFSAGARTIGGILTKPPTMPIPLWRYYFNVDDIDAAAKRVTNAGGQIIDGPLQLPADTWIVHCTDPQGAMFALEGMRRRSAPGYFERVTSPERPDLRGRRWSW